jgi:hypothetical protein
VYLSRQATKAIPFYRMEAVLSIGEKGGKMSGKVSLPNVGENLTGGL